MPQVKRVLSLFDLCVKYISENIDELSQKVTTVSNDINSGPSSGFFNDLRKKIIELFLNICILSIKLPF